MILGFTPVLVAVAIFLGTVFDVPLRRALWLVALVALPCVIVAALHMLENRDTSSFVPRELS